MKIFNNLKIKFSLKSRAINKINFKYKDNESWAIITGCTSGIGKSYSEILGENNFNLILISRNEDKLKDLKDNLINLNKEIKTIILKFDFSDSLLYNKENNQKYLDILSKLNIRFLINNVGESSYGGDFYKYDFMKNKSIIDVNINSNVYMTQLFINSQIKYIQDNIEKNNDKKRGIINVSSYFGKRPVAGQSIYSSSKCFISNFSSSIYYELKKQKELKIDIICINPLFVKTNMVRKWKYSSLLLEPSEIVYSSLVRINSYTIQSYGHWKHIIQSLILNLIPEFIFCKFTEKFYTNQLDKLLNIKKRIRENKK